MTDRQALLAGLSPEKRALLLQRLQERTGAPGGSGTGPPALVPDPAGRHDPFPLTDLQRAYWLGRTDALELGTIASRGYVELACTDLDLERLERAWQHLLARHDMLRVVVPDAGHQRVLPRVPPYRIPVADLRGLQAADQAARLEATFRRMASDRRPAGDWPLFELGASRLDARRTRLHATFDLLAVDAASIAILFRELATLQREPDAVLPPLELTFRDCVRAREGLDRTDAYARAREYWLPRLATLAGPPALPLASSPGLAGPARARHTARLDAASTGALKARAAQLGVTVSGICLAAYAEVLAAWSTTRRFTINIPILDRPPLHPQVGEVVGPFMSVLLCEVDLTAPEPLAARARRVQAQLLDDLAHRAFDGVAVQRELARSRGPEAAVMPVVFTSLVDHRFGDSIGQLGIFVRGLNQTAQVWMDLHVDEERGALVFHWDAVDGLFPDGMVADMLDAYVRRLTHVALERDLAPDADFRFAPPAQLAQRRAVNATAAPLPPLLLQAPFVEQARARPAETAVVAADRRLCYGELLGHANRLGRRLRELGARPNTLVAVVMDKGWEQVLAVLGILQAGAAYLPVDPSLPPARLHYLLRHGEVRIALTQSRLARALDWPDGLERIAVDTDPLAGMSDAPLEPLQTPQDLAYVMFTSGSTGLPKGVMIDHRGALNTVLDVNRRFAVGADDRVLALSALSFDLSVYDIFGLLAAGGTIVMPDAARPRDPAHWLELLARERVTIWNTVPALLAMLMEFVGEEGPGLPPPLRLALLSGDWIPVGLPPRLRAIAPQVQTISLGGATEASIWSIIYPIDGIDPTWKSIPYGRAMANQSWHVLDDGYEPRPVWVAGELYIGGVGLAQGYWRDPERTRASFVRHPTTGEPLYRTGDQGRFLPDGTIEFLGRNDTQVKVQGYRIELGEIEAALAQHAELSAAVAAAVGDVRGKKRLVAYVVPRHGPGPTAEELRRFAAGLLPDYMVPTAFVTLERLPLSPNGKIDRRALPDVPAAGPTDAPRPAALADDGLLARVTEVVRGVLDVEGVDADANLLSLGAVSIDLIRIGNQLEKTLGHRPPMDQLFRRQTVRDLAAYYAERPGAPPSPAAPDGAGPSPAATLRAAGRERQPGLRGGGGVAPAIPLVAATAPETRVAEYLARRSHRAFSPRPVPFAALGALLSCLRPIVSDGRLKYLYASAGSLYPNQVYVHAKAGRVEQVPGGVYYYHPLDHRLVPLAPGAELDREIHVPFVNQPVFESAAFSLFIVAQLAAITPEYGEHALRFATLEAGLMAQLLETAATPCGLGLCQIGSLDFDRIRGLFALDPTHQLVHSLLGGRLEPEEGAL